MASNENRLTRVPRLSTDLDTLKRKYLTSESKPPELPVPPRLPIPVKSGSLFPPPPPKLKAIHIQQGTPWHNYSEVIKDDQAGPCIIAHKNELEFTIVVVKKRAATLFPLDHIVQLSHPNIVCLEEVYATEKDIYFIYNEYLEVTLGEIRASPSARLEDYELAAICKEVLTGIKFIHNKLNIQYGHLDINNILVSLKGNIKLANIGESMLNRSLTRVEDIKAVGAMLIQLIEPATRERLPNTLTPTYPDRWSNSCWKFLEKTKTTSLAELLEDDFLKKSPGPSCLIPHVLKTKKYRIKM